jgi:hypothetical protein
MLLQWQQQQGAADSSSEATLDAELQRCLAGLQLQALTLPVECLLLAPSADMASSCLQLMALLAEQADAAERTAVDDALVDMQCQWRCSSLVLLCTMLHGILAA